MAIGDDEKEENSEEVYDASSIQVLKGLDSVRKRPGMYIGDTENGDAVNHVIQEIVANGVDQFLIGNLTKITVAVKDGTIIISDDGSFFPFEQKDRTGQYTNLVEFYLMTLHGCATADGHAPHIHISNRGVGLAVLNALSEHFLIESSDGKKLWSQSFGKGKILSGATCQKGNFTKGTTLTLRLDPEIIKHTDPHWFDLRKSLCETAYLFPGLTISYGKEVFFAKNGLLDLGYLILKDGRATEEFTRMFHYTGQKDDISFQVAILDECEGKTDFRSWANGRPTVSGTHVKGVQKALKANGWTPELALVHIIMDDPKYAGPCRDILEMDKVRQVLEGELTPKIKAFLSEEG